MSLERAGEKEAKLDLPQRKFFTDALASEFERGGLGPEAQAEGENTLNDVLDEYLEEHVANTRIFESSSGAKFPYTMFDSAEFAKRLYRAYAGHEPSISAEPETKQSLKKTMEFTFSTPISPMASSTLLPYEEHLRQLVAKLPDAIEALNRHEEPKHFELYALGSPTNLTGELSEQFMSEARSDTYGAFGKLFGEFVQSRIPADSKQQKNTNVSLYGMSMGASFAMKTGEYLLNKRAVIQLPSADAEKTLAGETSAEGRVGAESSPKLPNLSIRADLPVGLNESKHRSAQVPIGFLASGIGDLTSARSRAWMQNEGKLMGGLARELKRRHGIEENVSAEQETWRKEMFPDMNPLHLSYGLLVQGLRAGTPVPDGLQVTTVYGSVDPYTSSPEQQREIAMRQRKAPSLGRNIISSPSENVRNFTASMRHAHNWLRPTELQKMARGVLALMKLKQRESAE